MSKLSRYDLLISLVRSELRCQHDLGLTAQAQEENHLIASKSIEAWVFLADDLMCENNLSLQSRNTRIKRLLDYVSDCHISSLLSSLKCTYEVLISHISQKRVLQDYSDFKGQLEEKGVTDIGILLSPIKESLISVIASQTVVSSGCYQSDVKRHMWVCSHYLQFLNKLNFKDVGLEAKALSEYEQAELETSNLSSDSYEPYVRPLQAILKRWLKDWRYDGQRPKHGPGSVADTRRGKLEKYKALAVDERLTYLYGGLESLQSVFPFAVNTQLKRMSKLVFVPKNISKLRSISMEPASLQYIQQGCMESLYGYFRTQPQLRNILKLHDQHQNKSWAYHGSITNQYATIDLSHASDSVNWNFTKRLLSRVPHLLKWLICTRSTHTLLPDGRIIELTKFAPMGSALCFPVESLIFAAIAELSIKLSKEQALDRDKETGIRDTALGLSVYGDDIILPVYAAPLCIKILKACGFTPNEEKSYLEGPFKESCGGNFFCGYDITALKFSPKYDSSYDGAISPSAYTALCSYANLAYERGFSLLRLHCIKVIFEAGLKPLFVDNLDTSGAIFSPTPTNFHLKKVYRKRYQKYQFQYVGTKAVVEDDDPQDLIDEVIFKYDYFAQRAYHPKECNTAGAEVKGNTITFDSIQPYQRGTLLTQATKFSSCFSDV